MFAGRRGQGRLLLRAQLSAEPRAGSPWVRC
jgi:hypothetical protein